MINNILMVGLGGGLGSMLRYLVQKWMQQPAPGAFPTATLLVNITGCFFIGLLWGWISRSVQVSEETRLLLMTGICGGFTTFSAFTLESIGLLRENKTGLLLLYISGSVIMGLIATYIGIRITK